MKGSVSEAELCALRAVAVAGARYEPFPSAIISPTLLDRLAAAGFVEIGASYRPTVRASGYRLSPEGWRLASENWTHRASELVE